MDPYEFSVETVKEAGEYLLIAKGEVQSISSKGGNTRDIVTTTDREVNEQIISKIQSTFPTHGIYSEEGGGQESASEHLWVIDPIDGTANFSRGIPHFAVSLGLLVNGVPETGAIYNPVTRELFSFKRGEGAFLNGVQISVSTISPLAKAQVIFSPGSRKAELWDWGASSYRKLLEHAFKRGMYGSSGLDICFIAAGRVDAAAYGTLTTLDIAPAIGILREAGGVMINSEGEDIAFIAEPQKAYMGNSREMAEEIRALLES